MHYDPNEPLDPKAVVKCVMETAGEPDIKFAVPNIIDTKAGPTYAHCASLPMHYGISFPVVGKSLV